ncbi:MAG: hypothetical protein AB7F99_16775 [Vicinamibacterales bacterium]
MKASNDSGFGVIVACCEADYPLAKGCCASLREHLGDVPLTLLVDGDFSVEAIVRGCDARVMRARGLDPELAESTGYGLTKMLAFWHSPYEQFLYLDADTILWGNPLVGLEIDADLIVNEPHEPYTEFILKSQYFDYDRIFDHTDSFDWRGCPFFNTGVLVGRRGVLDKREYLELLAVKKRDHSLLLCGDQGILNLMVFRGASQGRLTVRTAPLQTVLPVVAREELERRFQIVEGRPRIDPIDRTVIHWAGAKPFSLHRQVFRLPMMHYRRKALAWNSGVSPVPSSLLLWMDEWRADPRQAMPPEARDGLRRIRRRLSAGPRTPVATMPTRLRP